MSRNIRLQIFVDNEVNLKIRDYMRLKHQDNESKAVFMMLKEFNPADIDSLTGLPINTKQLSTALENSFKEIDKLKEKNLELTFAIKNIYGKQFKEINVVGKDDKVKVKR